MPVQFKLLRRVVLCAGITAVPLPLGAQDSPLDHETPRVERITFSGAEALSRTELRASIVTEETSCRGFLLRPLCAITDWRIIQPRRYLNRDELAADELRLRVHYFQRGFRSATVESRLAPRGRGVEVIFHIDEGPATLLEEVTVEQATSVLSGRQVRRANLPHAGERLDLIRLSAGAVGLAQRMGERGYLDGAVHDTIELSPDELSARLSVRLEPGRRATLGELDIVGNEQVSDRTIGNALRLTPGGVLRTNDVIASQRSLYESNLFHEARVRVPEQPDSVKRVEIVVREAPPRAARIGTGFNTVEFAQVEGRITHYNFRGGGRRLDLRATVGNLLAEQLNGRGLFQDVLPEGQQDGDAAEFLKPTWLASVELVQPAFRSAANAVGLNAFTHRRIVPGIVVDQGFGGEASITRRFDYRTPASLSYRYELNLVEAGDLYFCVNYGICELLTIAALRSRHSLSPAAFSFFADRANDPLSPSSGYRLRLDAEHASGATLSDFRHNRITAEASGYHPLDVNRRRVIAGRLRTGWVSPLSGTAAALGLEDRTGELDRMLHPRKRFYAGGARSVRGYRENQLGPRVLTVDPAALLEHAGCGTADLAACDPNSVPVEEFLPRPVGGTTVIESSVEYRFPLGGRYQGAVFVDAGLVGEQLGSILSDGVGAITPGFGVRMDSPVGPVRIDLGMLPHQVRDLDVLTEYVDAQGERRLLRLTTQRRYDPLVDTRGFLNQLLARLTLHLSIGEAF